MMLGWGQCSGMAHERRRIALGQMQRLSLTARVAVFAVVFFIVAVIAWWLWGSQSAFIDDWLPSIAANLLSVAFFATLLQRLFEHQERNQLRPLVDIAIGNALAPFVSCLLERWLTHEAAAAEVASSEAGLKVTAQPPETIEDLCEWWDADLTGWISRAENPQLSAPPYQAIVESLEPLGAALREVTDRFAAVLTPALYEALYQASEGLLEEGGANLIARKMDSFRPLFDGGGPNEASVINDLRGVARDLINLATAYQKWAGVRLGTSEGSRLEASRRLTPTPTQESKLLAQQHHPRAPNPGSV